MDAAPHLVGRPIALVRCPEGASGQCFFQKHARAGIPTEHLHLVAEKGDKIISIDDLDGLIALVQGGVLEIHTRGTTIDDRESADRLVFDLDPGPGTGWKDVMAAARDVRERLSALKLKSFLKTSGGKGLTSFFRSNRRHGRRRRPSPKPLPKPWKRMSPSVMFRRPPRRERNKRDIRRLPAQQP